VTIRVRDSVALYQLLHHLAEFNRQLREFDNGNLGVSEQSATGFDGLHTSD
jgi:hypothetical protein